MNQSVSHEAPKRLAQSSDTNEDTINFVDLLALLKRSWLAITFFVLAGLAIGAWYAYVLVDPRYAASTTLVFEVNEQQVIDLNSVVTGVSSDSTALATEMQVLKSRRLLHKVVEDLNLTSDPEFNWVLAPLNPFTPVGIRSKVQEIITGEGIKFDRDPESLASLNRSIGALSRAVSSEIVRGTYAFDIRVETKDPQKSAEIANKVAELYIADQIDVKFEATERAIAWLTDRVAELEIEVEEKQDEVEAIRRQTSIVDTASATLLNQRVLGFLGRYEQAKRELDLARSEEQSLRSVRETGNLQDIVEQFDDPIMTRLLRQSATLDTAEDEIYRRADMTLAALSQSIQRDAAKVDALEQAWREVDDSTAVELENFARLRELERELSATQSLFEIFEVRLKETSIQRGLQAADARILSESPDGFYVFPRKPRILAMAAVAGFLLATVLIISRQYLFNGFRTQSDLEKLTGLPVFGQIPIVQIRKRSGLVPYILANPTSAFAEAFRNLRTSIQMSSPDKAAQVIMLTSSVPGEGKTTNSIALANSFIGVGKRVILVEGDIRRQTLLNYFKANQFGHDGILSALGNLDLLPEYIRNDPETGIDLLLGEKSSVNSGDIFSSKQFHSLIERLRGEYDIILIDTPPVMAVPDARIIGQIADAVVFNVAWNRTSRQLVSSALGELYTANIHVNGLVMGQVNIKSMNRYGYGYGYGNYNK